MLKTNRIIGILLIALAFTGCKTTKKVGTVETSGAKSYIEFFEQIQEQSFGFNTLTARLNVDLDFPGNNLSSRVELKMVKDSAFQLSVIPFLGIEVFRMELTTDSVKVIDRMNKRYVADNYANLKGQTPIEFNFYNLQALFTNQLFLPGQQSIAPKQYNRFKLKQEGIEAEITVKDAMGLIYTFLADGEEKILATHISEPSDKYSLQWDYSDFRVTDGKAFPMRMKAYVFDGGESKGGITLSFSRLQKDVPVSLEFSVPAKYQKITLAQIIKSLSQKAQ